MPFYPTPVRSGTFNVASLGDGYTISVSWRQAVPTVPANKIAYHIYYATVKNDVFTEGVKYVSIDDSLVANIIGLIPGQNYFFCVRPVEYDGDLQDLTDLPIAYDNLRFYPSSLLSSDITSTDLTIPLLDVEGFPSTGIVRIGVELVQYLAVDSMNNTLVVMGGSAGTPATFVDQGGGDFYTSAITNTGDGYINSLTAIPLSNALSETWNILCVSVQRTILNAPLPATAKFIAIGSISGGLLDGYGNPFIWTANDTVTSNGIFSFSIEETTTFVEGDSFKIIVDGATPGTTGGRGFNGTSASLHTTDGYDGRRFWDALVSLFTLGESSAWDSISVCQSRFEYPDYQYTVADGYHQVTKDLLNSDYTQDDAANMDFPMYDFAGYHRTDPVQLLDGTCVGSYIGGEMGCIDKYGNVQMLRGFSLQDQNSQRQEVLLSVDGRPAILIKRSRQGITCSCYLPSSEYADDRCPKCYGTKFVFGYEQYFNPRRSDGRILLRQGPTAETNKMTEAGLESEFPLDLWTLNVPTIHMRDVLVFFDVTGVNEEFRYEVAEVTRNQTILGMQGGQHLKAIRIRKTDPAYQIRVFHDSSMFPSKLNTSIGFVAGIPPHTHEIVISEKITSVNQINQTTAVSQGHNHPIVNGVVMEVLGHTHTIILP